MAMYNKLLFVSCSSRSVPTLQKDQHWPYGHIQTVQHNKPA